MRLKFPIITYHYITQHHLFDYWLTLICFIHFFGIKLTLPNGCNGLIGHARLVALLNGSELVIGATTTEIDEPGALLEDFVEVGLLNG